MTTNTRLINRTALKTITMAVLAERRPHLATKFSRIGGDFFDHVEHEFRAALDRAIDNAPTTGKTLHAGFTLR